MGTNALSNLMNCYLILLLRLGYQEMKCLPWSHNVIILVLGEIKESFYSDERHHGIRVSLGMEGKYGVPELSLGN